MPDKKRYGKYDVVGKLGVGGMGVVYKGYDPLINRYVAIKTMSIDKGVDENLKKRFYREAQSAGILNHANIVTIFDMDEEEGQPYIAMELLSGVDLKEIISKRIQLPLEKKVDIITQACDGLDYAHKHGIVHRDIKPGNIRLLDNGLVKILDFGIARIESSELTKTGMVMGTVSYMSPEQIAGKRVDGRADVFSIGVVFYELMTGRKPFPGEAITTIIYKIMNESPEALSKHDVAVLPAPVEKIINRALEKDLNKRYATAGVMAEELRSFLSSLQAQDSTLAEIDVGGATMIAGRTLTVAPKAPPKAAAPPAPATPPPAAPPAPSKSAAMPQAMPLMPKPSGTPAKDSEGTLFARPATPSAAAPAPVAPPAPKPPPPKSTPPKPPPPKPAPPRPAARPALDLGEAPPPARSKAPAKGPVALVVVGVLAVVAVVAVVILIMRGGGTPPAAGKGQVSIDASPWARVREVVNLADNTRVDVKDVVTPCRLDLPAGKYEITLEHDTLGQEKVPVEIPADGVVTVSKKMPGFDLDAVLKSL